jgi:hypothetical protein
MLGTTQTPVTALRTADAPTARNRLNGEPENGRGEHTGPPKFAYITDGTSADPSG